MWAPLSPGESVALVDVMLAFAVFVHKGGGSGPFCRPKIAHAAPLVLKRCRHPLLERFAEPGQPLTPNDVAITHATNLQVTATPEIANGLMA